MESSRLNFFKEAYLLIQTSKNILIIGHVNPDSDAISSVASLVELSLLWNKNFTAFCLNKPQYAFSFLPHEEKILSQTNFKIKDFDLLVVVDCGSISRTGLANEIRQAKEEGWTGKIIEFDHHPKVDDYSNVEIRNPEASATTEVIYDFLEANKVFINKKLATLLLAGILTDTANFLYSSARDKTILIASELLQRGAQFPKIMEKIMNKKSFSTVKIWGKVLNNLYINKKYNLAVAVLNFDDLKDYIDDKSFEDEAFGEIAGFLSNLSDIKTILFLREPEPGYIKGSLRATAYNQNIDLSKLAMIFGGGGHKKAAGFSLSGKLIKVNKNKWLIE
ncbi:MAG: DHH family phosphoesterase [Candidatus Pacebacteria bacterium]|nr:DHH family phosphoesterase [Candidatus Paceibacterota bacterium]